MSKELDLISNSVGFIGALYKAADDLYFGPKYFKEDQQIMEVIDAARKKKKRAKRATTFAFVALTISFILRILGGLMECPVISLK